MTERIPDVFNKNQKHKFNERYLERCYSYTPPKKRYWDMKRVIISGLLIKYFPMGVIWRVLKFPLCIILGGLLILLMGVL